jgi:hypothetical protein
MAAILSSASALCCSRQTASRLFSGDNLPRYHLFTTLLAELGVAGEDRDRALELWEIADSDTVTSRPAICRRPTFGSAVDETLAPPGKSAVAGAFSRSVT